MLQLFIESIDIKMFKRIVSLIPFSPSTIHSLGFYAKRLKNEEITRRIGLILMVIALAVQSLISFSPPESANAASSNDMIYGGANNAATLMSSYDGNANNIRDFYDTIGITRAEIAAASNNVQILRSNAATYSWGMNPHFGAARGEGSYTIRASQGGTRTFYYRPHTLWGDFTYKAFVGNSAKLGWFAIQFNCGNLILKTIPPAPTCPPGQIGTYPNCSVPPAPTATCNTLSVHNNGNSYQFTVSASVANGATINQYIFNIYRNGSLVKTISDTKSTVTYQEKTPGEYKVVVTVKTSLGDKTSSGCEKTFTIPEPAKCPQNPNLLQDDPKCQPCPGDTTLWINDERCSASFIKTKSAVNLTQNSVNATTTTAKAGDRITYTLSVKNKGLKEEDFTFTDYVGDVLEYATIFDYGGGTLTKGDGDLTPKTLTWPSVKIKPGETQTRSFTIRINSSPSAMATGYSNPTSYDCRIDNTFGNTVSTQIDCPAPKIVEQTISELPRTGSGSAMMIGGVFMAIVTFLYLRSRQLKKEIKIIRKDMTAGVI